MLETRRRGGAIVWEPVAQCGGLFGRTIVVMGGIA